MSTMPPRSVKGARLLDDLGRAVAGLHPGSRQLLQPHDAAYLDGAQGKAQFAGGQGLLDQRAGRGDDDRRRSAAALQGRQRSQPPLA
ncbi:MAG: hypothetical protein H6640_03880 [Caldilineaceae bacterium]|nr:hypothetical protein [Caldilineaceae bacterium]